MKNVFVAIVLLLTISCSSHSNAGNNGDSTSKVAGNSAGAITMSADSARMDTSLGRITTDSAR